MRLMITYAAAVLALAAGAPALAQGAAPNGGPASSSAAPGATTPSTGGEAGASAGAATAAGAAMGGGVPAARGGALTVGLPVKDKTGAVIGSIADLKPGPGGDQATVKMGDQSFAIGAKSFVVINGAAVINATQDQLKAMIANAAQPQPG
jgi:hypothetical protein